MKTHSESLLQIPLVARLFENKSVSWQARNIDNNWFYEEHLPAPVGGFNPALGTLYYGRVSNFATWLKDKKGSARKYNFEDNLMHEVLFSVHDYFHLWAYRAIHHLMPELKMGTGEVTLENFEDYVYLHLLSETVATIGLDFWYLSQIDLNSVVSIGTKATTLTTKFYKSQLAEFQKFNANFDPYQISFFATLDDLYCYAKVKGFSGTTLERSPAILGWMKHEYKYGEVQRQLTRQWINFLSAKNIIPHGFDLTAPLKPGGKWRKELRDQVGKLLWKKVINGIAADFAAIPQEKVWTPPSNSQVIDYRFFNINSFGENFWDKVAASYYPKESEPLLFSQIVSKYKLEDIDPGDLDIILDSKVHFNLKILQHVFSNYKPIKGPPESSNIFLAG